VGWGGGRGRGGIRRFVVWDRVRVGSVRKCGLCWVVRKGEAVVNEGEGVALRWGDGTPPPLPTPPTPAGGW